MKLLISLEMLEGLSYKVFVPLECLRCGETFFVTKKRVVTDVHRPKNFCGLSCVGKARSLKKEVVCQTCQVLFRKASNQIFKTKHNFCSKSCAAKYNNSNRTTGTRVSKLELYLQPRILSLFPGLGITFNKRDVIGSELDIYVAAIKHAFELNGFLHYEPVYGENKLAEIQNNDRKKAEACKAKSIVLHVIDSSTMKHFNVMEAEKYLATIADTIRSAIGS